MLNRRFKAVCSLTVSILFLGSVTTVHASNISGVHEVVFGVSDIDDAVAYWERFGYRLVDEGKLSEKEAMALYHVPSKANVARMKHMKSDHNMVRLWEWENETGPGAGISRLLTPGTRWVSSYLKNQSELYYQALAHQMAGNPIHIVPPQVHTNGPQHEQLHMGDFSGYAEVVILTPDYRRVFAQRWGEERPNFGSTENWDSHYQSTQITHVGFTFAGDDPSVLDFYPDVLDIAPRRPERTLKWDGVTPSSGANIMGTRPGEELSYINYGNPTDTETDRRFQKSGSLLIRRILPDPADPPVQARPGAHGLTLFTYAVKNIDDYHRRVSGSDATQVTEILSNEFGEKSFSFVSPDGMDWNLVEWK